MRKSNNEIFCIFGAIIFLFACFNSNSAAAMNPLAHSTTKSQLKNTNNVATLPKYDTLSTGTISLAVGVDGSFGGEGDAGASGVYMDYFFFSPECDTTVSIPGDTRLYLYDGSVFVGGIVGGDTVVSNVIFHGPLDTCPTCFYQMTNETHPTTDDVIQFYNTGVFRNNDSTIGLQLTYYAPQFTVNFDFGPGKIWKADEQFITKELKVWSLNGMTRENITVGEVIDWDIPSDWWYDNTGEVDESRNLLYGAGAEYNQDDSVECQDNSLRFGGIAFGYFKRFVAHPDTIAWFIVDSVPYGGYHESNRRYFYGNSWNDN